MLTELKIPGFIEGYGDEIRKRFVVPALSSSINYSRISSYFKIDSLVSLGLGLDGLWDKEGSVRLILGDHDMDEKLLNAFIASTDEEDSDFREQLEEQLASEATKISDELERNAVATVAWLIDSGRLEIRVAATRHQQRGSILHNKRFLFEDENGNVIAGSGSQNETSLTNVHYEEISIHKSWQDSATTNQMLESFEKIWKGENPSLLVRPLSKALANKLLQALGKNDFLGPSPSVGTSGATTLLEAALASPAFSQFTLRKTALYPHQERALLDVASRMPLRAVLADEVGLGKTLEAISLINFALKFGNVRRILLVTPPNLMLQWQEELFTSLGIDFLRWESSTGHYVNHRKEVTKLAGQSQPLGADSPNFVLMSNAKFRDRSFLPFLKDKHRVMPDLLIVDEAHAARVSIDANSGKRKETLLWKRLDDVAKNVDNLLLLTATPMQVHPIEFFELLKLIGLPQGWDTYSVFERSLSWIASGSKAPSLPEASYFAQLLPSLLKSFGKEGLSRFPELRPTVNEFTVETDEFKKSSLVRSNWTDFRKLLTLLHPANQLVVRNTRTGLEPLGYKFPERDFAAPDLNISDAIHSFHDDLSKYLSDGFGITEEAQGNSKSGRSAFQKSRWWERTASSLHAALISTSNRIAKLEDAAEGKLIEITSDEWDEPVHTANQNPSSSKNKENVRQTALKEISYLSALKAKAEAILEESGGLEPKFLATRDVVNDAIVAKSPILVFSKFVNTLEGCIDFLAPTLQNAGISYGLYTGQKRQLFMGGEKLDVSKQTIVDALNEGELGVIFCSEAASEGLNLQSANRLLNIDVPWNPAKLEQRIGRIARLGQKAATVQITNLWYPGSIEGRMYGRLLARKDLFALAVGEMPDLFSDAIESAIGMNLDPATTAASASSSLEKFRDEIQRKALREVWNQNLETSQASTQFRSDLLELLRQRGEFPKTYLEDQVNPGSKKPLTLWDLRDVPPGDLGETGYVLVAIAFSTEITAGFACQSPSGMFRLLKPEKLISWMLQEDKEDSSLYDSGWIPEGEIASALNAILPSQRWLPASAKDFFQQRLVSSKAFEVLDIKEVA